MQFNKIKDKTLMQECDLCTRVDNCKTAHIQTLNKEVNVCYSCQLRKCTRCGEDRTKSCLCYVFSKQNTSKFKDKTLMHNPPHNFCRRPLSPPSSRDPTPSESYGGLLVWLVLVVIKTIFSCPEWRRERRRNEKDVDFGFFDSFHFFDSHEKKSTHTMSQQITGQ